MEAVYSPTESSEALVAVHSQKDSEMKRIDTKVRAKVSEYDVIHFDQKGKGRHQASWCRCEVRQ